MVDISNENKKCFDSACLSRDTRKPKPHVFCSEGLGELTLFLWRALKMLWGSYRGAYESLFSPLSPCCALNLSAVPVGLTPVLLLCLSIFSTERASSQGPTQGPITPSTSSRISLMAPYCNCSLNCHLFWQTVSSLKAGSVATFLTLPPPPPRPPPQKCLKYLMNKWRYSSFQCSQEWGRTLFPPSFSSLQAPRNALPLFPPQGTSVKFLWV